MPDDNLLTITIPSYMEEENLRVLLPRIKKTLESMPISYVINIVDAMNELDGTKLVCEETGVNYISRIGGNTYGDAVRTGIQKAKGEYILFMDADGSHTPEFIPKLYMNRSDCDIVVASRYVRGGTSENNISLRIMSKFVNTVYSHVLGIQCKDVSNSFKLYNTSHLKELMLESNNFDIIEEILVKIKRNRSSLIIKEIPYCFKNRMFGSTKRNLILFMFSYVFTLIKLRYKK
jgi:dolichol-phosphate mannosyltransferase